jgi:S-adenosylmethionine-diacylglycerol 3-amino-3-carboxypropyl transferase
MIATTETNTKSALLNAAVHRNKLLSIEGMLERAFTLAFQDLVYAQIWEDPVVDMAALELRDDSRIATIASGGCNILSYLTANPAAILAVDLNSAHLALNKMKLAAAQRLPDYETFYRLFGDGNDARNVVVYDKFVAPHLDATTQKYWSKRSLLGRRRIEAFAHNFYKTGLLGRFMGAAHTLAKLNGVDPRIMLTANSIEQQREIFATRIAPVFDRWIVKKLLDNPMSLYGLGIPPAQYKELGASAPRMADVVKERLRKLSCDFDIRDNYFAWAAFNRGYASNGRGPLPLYLQPQNYEIVKARAQRVSIAQISMTTFLERQPAESLDRYILLDAQDWMSNDDLGQLWTAITKSAKPGSRVIYRTAAAPTILPGRIPAALLSQWTYHEARSAELFAKDRSAIYGGFHLYTKA